MMTLSSINITGFKIAAERAKKMIKQYKAFEEEKEAGKIPEQELISVREEIRLLERSINMDGNMKEEVKPIRQLLNQLEKEVEYSLELQRTLRDNLTPVLNQQPKIEKSSPVDEDLGASSSVFNDLDSLSRRIKGHNSGLLELLEDLEI